MDWDRRDVFLQGKNKIKAELDVVDILKSLRDIKLMTRVIFETHQVELLKFNREGLLTPSAPLLQTNSQKPYLIPTAKKLLSKDHDIYEAWVSQISRKFDKNKVTQIEHRLLKETLQITPYEEEHKQVINTQDSQLHLINDLYPDDISNI